MSELDVRIVELPPLRVASFHGFGEGPEDIAWAKLEAWAQPRGYRDDPQHHRIFGFNNPNPTPGSPAYGYEFWIEIGPEVQAEGEMRIVDFAGGLYAVARCSPRPGAFETIGETWQKLVTWREDSRYRSAGHQCLEEHIDVTEPGQVFDLDLYLPIAE